MSSLPPAGFTALPETDEYETGIYQIAKTDPVIGGDGGVSNYQAQQLANRTNYLYTSLNAEVARAQQAEALKAPIANPTLTGGLKVTGGANTSISVGTIGTAGTPNVAFLSSGSSNAGQIDAEIYAQGGSSDAGGEATLFLAANTTQVNNLVATGIFQLPAASTGIAMGSTAQASALSMTFHTSGYNVPDTVFNFTGGTQSAGYGVCQAVVSTFEVTGALNVGGAAAVGGAASVGGTLTVLGGSASIAGGGNTNLAIGTKGTAGTPNVTFRSSGSTTNDFDVEMYSLGGNTGADGTGTLVVSAAAVSLAGALNAAGAIAGPSLALAGSGVTIGAIPAGSYAAFNANMPQGYAVNLLNLAINGQTLFAISQTGSCAMSGYLTLEGALTAGGVVTMNGGSATLAGGGNTNLAIGTPGTAGTPNITFKSSGSATTFCDVEIYASGGDTTIAGNGTLNIAAAQTIIAGKLSVTQQSDFSAAGALVPTQSAGDNSGQAASTAYVDRPLPLPFQFAGPGSGTYTVPAGVFMIEIEICASGGTGATAGVGNAGGGGGGGGGGARITAYVTPGQQIQYTVASAAAAPSATEGINGNAGLPSAVSLNGATFQVSGGGLGATSGSQAQGGPGGSGGGLTITGTVNYATTAVLSLPGSPGGDGTGAITNSETGQGGFGGASMFGGGGRGGTTGGVASNAWGSGSGAGYTANGVNVASSGAGLLVITPRR